MGLSLGQLDAMTKKRAEAVSAVKSWFNDRARENLHDDLLSIAAGKPDALAAREAHRQKVLTKIASMASPAELAALLADISKV